MDTHIIGTDILLHDDIIIFIKLNKLSHRGLCNGDRRPINYLINRSSYLYFVQLTFSTTRPSSY